MHIAARRAGDGRWRIIVIKIMERISHSARLYIVQNICNDFKWKMISFLVFHYGGIQSSYDEATWWEWGGVRGSSDKVQALLNFSSSFHLPPLLLDISIWKYAKFKYLLSLVLVQQERSKRDEENLFNLSWFKSLSLSPHAHPNAPCIHPIVLYSFVIFLNWICT